MAAVSGNLTDNFLHQEKMHMVAEIAGSYGSVCLQ